MAGLDPAISFSAVPREMAGSGAGHDAESVRPPRNLAPMGLDPLTWRGTRLVQITGPGPVITTEGKPT